MANCPNCGSEHIQLKRETNVNWGRAVAGWALFGVVGGAVGSVTGEDRNANVCLDCGLSWKAGDLYKTREIIKSMTGITLDLSRKKDRIFINDFIKEITPLFKKISDAGEREKNIKKRKQDRLEENANLGGGCGCLVGISGCTAIAMSAGEIGIWIILIPTIIGWIIGAIIDAVKRKSIEEKIINDLEKAKDAKQKAKENLERRIEHFIFCHPLEDDE